MKTIFLRALEADDKATALRAGIKKSTSAGGQQRFEVDPSSFALVYGSPFSYWVSDRIRGLFKSHPPFEARDRIVRQGGVTGNDARFLRTFWEIGSPRSKTGLRWVPFAKGGNVSPWYADYPIVVAWDDQRETFFGYTGLLHRPSEKPSSADHYFRAGLTWPLRAARFAPVPLPRDSIFSIRGYAILSPEKNLLALGAIGHSVLFDFIFKVALGRFGFPEFVVGVLQKLPLPTIPADVGKKLADAARRAWALRRDIDTRSETSRAFVLPVVLQMRSESIEVAAQAWLERIRVVDAEIGEIQTEIDEWCFDLYDIDEADRRSIREGFGGGADHTSGPVESGADVEDETDDGSDAEDEVGIRSSADAVTLAEELVSWAVGVAFGCFDVRLATGQRSLPAEPEPFDPLPAYSPGMLVSDEGLRATNAPAEYPVAFPENGILENDPGHRRDLTRAVRAVFDEVFIARADAIWSEVSALLDPTGRDLGAFLAAGFAEYHLKRYAKSRRKAPVFWQFPVTSGRYSVWLYCHRLTRDSLFQVQNEVVTPKLAQEERELTRLVKEAGSNPSAKEQKVIADQGAFVEELRSLLDEVRRIAPLWNPVLDDGVVLTMAPLWRLVPQPKAWQKELKSKWDELAVGKYDWAHVAMHLWPERVVPRCATDRGLSITHGLEDIFWVEGLSGHWRQRASIADTVRYLNDNLYSDRLRQTVEELVAFSEAHATTSGHGPGWWTVLSMGGHDDLALALALWPERVLRKAVADPTRFTTLGIRLPRARTGEELLANLLNTHRPRLLEHELQILGEFCDYSGDRDIWRQRWAEFTAGVLDEYGLARYIHTPRVVAKAQSDPDFAELHDLFRWFWLSKDSGPRQLKEPPDEIADAIHVRTSFAVKAALKSLLEAPGATAGGGRGRARQATTAAADGETV